MDHYDQLYRLYADFDTGRLRDYQEFVSLVPPLDSAVALELWEQANDELEDRKRAIRDAFEAGDVYAELAARVTRDQAFTALDLATKHGRPVSVLVLDVDETLRSAGGTDNEIPRGTLHALTEFHEAGVPIVICTGQTLENVKGFAIQGLGSRIIHSGSVSIVYEAGSGVFTPGHGPETKQLLYTELDETIRGVFEAVRAGALSEAPPAIRDELHLQGNEFNVTLKPNYPIGSREAARVIDRALEHLLDLLGTTLAGRVGLEETTAVDQTVAHYARVDPEIAAVVDPVTVESFDPDLVATLERIDVAYYEADGAEVGSRELTKEVGVERALSVLGLEDPFALVMGDSKSDRRVMEWVAERNAGIAAAPTHASPDVRTHVEATDELLFEPGQSEDVLRTVQAMNLLAGEGRAVV